MSHSSNTSSGPQRYRASVDQCTEQDFDGHTNFARLTPGQRLDWLDELIGFVEEFKGVARTPTPRLHHDVS